MSSAGTSRDFLRHALATLAYRGGKTLRGAPQGFASQRIGTASRTPLEVVQHLGDLLEWALSMAEGHTQWPAPAERTWDAEVERFFSGLARLDAFLASDAKLAAEPEALFQGPIADALTHVGQISMMRRLAGAPVRGENYFLADIQAGRVGREQSAPRREFD
jgi:hypothetical protein